MCLILFTVFLILTSKFDEIKWDSFCKLVSKLIIYFSYYIFKYYILWVFYIYRYADVMIIVSIFVWIVSFHLLSVNCHWKSPVPSKNVSPYNLSYINVIAFYWVGIIILGMLVLTPTLVYYLKGRNHDMLFFCIPCKEMEPCIWRHNMHFNWFVVREKWNFTPLLVLLNVFIISKVVGIDSY